MSYIQELLTDEDVFPTKAGKGVFISPALIFVTIKFRSEAFLSSLSFSRVRFPHGLHLSGPEGVFAVFQDSGSHLLGSLQRDTCVRPAPTPQHTLHTPHTLLPAARPARGRGHRAAAGPHHSSGTARRGLRSRHKDASITLIYLYLFIMLYYASHRVGPTLNVLHCMYFIRKGLKSTVFWTVCGRLNESVLIRPAPVVYIACSHQLSCYFVKLYYCMSVLTL